MTADFFLPGCSDGEDEFVFGDTILIDSIAGELYVNDARIVVPDVLAVNGSYTSSTGCRPSRKTSTPP